MVGKYVDISLIRIKRFYLLNKKTRATNDRNDLPSFLVSLHQ